MSIIRSAEVDGSMDDMVSEAIVIDQYGSVQSYSLMYPRFDRRGGDLISEYVRAYKQWISNRSRPFTYRWER